MTDRFTHFIDIQVPSELTCSPEGRGPACAIEIEADGPIPFPQVILRQHGREHLINGVAIAPMDRAPRRATLSGEGAGGDARRGGGAGAGGGLPA